MRNYFALGIALFPLLGFAQPTPDAGALQQQIERERQEQLPQRMAPQKPATPAPMNPTGMTVVVKQFRFTGNTLLTAEQLTPVVASYMNRPLDFAQLQAAAAAVAEAYRAAGWLVNAYLPKQDINDGTITIQVVEAVFGKVKFEGTPPSRLDSALLESIFTKQQAKGAFLNAKKIDRALLLADDLPGIAVSGALVSGESAGETDLAINTIDEPLVTGRVSLDNTGARSTGATLLNVNLNLNNLAGFGDLLVSNFIHNNGSDYLRLSYTVPVGSDGWRLGANASYLNYELTASEFKALNAQGNFGTVGLEANYPIVRSRLANLYLDLNADHRRFNNESLGATTSRYTINAGSIGLNGNLYDNWGGGGANSASLTLVSGSRDNEFGTTNQHFNKLRYSVARQQVLTQNLAFFAQLSGQASGDELDNSERFYLGGAGGVRAYPSIEGGGDSGAISSLELRRMLPNGFSLTGFYDYGYVDNNSAALSYSLKGYGAALGWQAPLGLNLKITWARRDGNNPNPTSTGKDQDGSLDKNRLWFSASLPF